MESMEGINDQSVEEPLRQRDYEDVERTTSDVCPSCFQRSCGQKRGIPAIPPVICAVNSFRNQDLHW